MMRKVSMPTRTELVAAIGERYRSADRASKGRVFDEFVAVTGFHRKHAMRLMRAGQAVTTANVRIERRIYDERRHAPRLSCSGKRRIGCVASDCGRSFRSCWRRWSAMVIWTWHRR